jgi:hypothetical protein
VLINLEIMNNIQYEEFINKKVNFYINSKDRQSEFESKLLSILKKNQNKSRVDKINYLHQVLKYIEEYADIIFTPLGIYNDFIIEIKKKVIEFRKEEKIKNICNLILDKYYNEYCKAYTLKHIRCGNRISKDISYHFCGAHCKKYMEKIMKLVMNKLSQDTASICVNQLY